MKRHPYANILIAIAEGKQIEFKHKHRHNWEFFNEDVHCWPGRFDDIEWRIKPEIVKVKGWINVYPDGTSDCLHATKVLADSLASSKRLACIEIEYEYYERQGLENRE